MATWIFEPGHTEAEFRARHMMVTWVRGLFKADAEPRQHASCRLRGEGRVNRHEFGVSWQDELPPGAIAYYREIGAV